MSTARIYSPSGRPLGPAPVRRSATLASVVAFVAFCCVRLSALAGQQGTGVLSGTVRSPDGALLAGAEIVVAGAPGVLSAADGHYVLSGVRLGEHAVEARLIGYHTAATTLNFQTGVTLQWNVTLEVNPVPVDPVDVSANRALTPALAAFYSRRDRGTGTYFTRREIEAMNARDLTDVLRRVPGARVVPIPGPFGTTNTLQLSRSQDTGMGRACPILYYVNGIPFPVRADIGIDAYVRAQDVEAVEVYSGSSRIPAEFTSSGQTSRCGVVALWTRAG